MAFVNGHRYTAMPKYSDAMPVPGFQHIEGTNDVIEQPPIMAIRNSNNIWPGAIRGTKKQKYKKASLPSLAAKLQEVPWVPP